MGENYQLKKLAKIYIFYRNSAIFQNCQPMSNLHSVNGLVKMLPLPYHEVRSAGFEREWEVPHLNALDHKIIKQY